MQKRLDFVLEYTRRGFLSGVECIVCRQDWVYSLELSSMQWSLLPADLTWSCTVYNLLIVWFSCLFTVEPNWRLFKCPKINTQQILLIFHKKYNLRLKGGKKRLIIDRFSNSLKRIYRIIIFFIETY